jgi:FkbM family methyltransferase
MVVREAAGVVDFIWNHPTNRGKRLSALMKAAEFQFRGRVLKQRMVVAIGVRSQMWAELHRTASSKVVYANPPDIEMLTWQHLLRPGDLFIDVGANVGAYSLIAAEAGATVIAAEPDAGTAARLRENAALNGYGVEVLVKAIGASEGIAAFTVGLDTVNRFDSGGGAQVEVCTLDGVLGNRHARGVKIDVEGFEMDVIRGVRSALAEHRIDLLQLEWNSASVKATAQHREPLAALLSSFGYLLHRPDAAGRLHPISDYGFGADVFAVAPGVI